MKKIVLGSCIVLTLIGGLVFGLKKIPVQEPLQNKSIDISSIHGNWMSEEYVKYLLANKDNLQSFENKCQCPCQCPYINIANINGEYTISRVTELNNKINGKLDNLKLIPNTINEYEISSVDEKGQSYKITCKANSNNRVNKLTFIEENKNPIKYVRVESDYYTYLNKVLLAGKYKDSKGNQYVFNDSQTAIWPNKTFKYQMALGDNQLNSASFITSNDEKSSAKVYYFKKIDEKLYIYNPTSMNKVNKNKVFAKPMLVLAKEKE